MDRYYYQLSDGQIWGLAEADWVTEIPADCALDAVPDIDTIRDRIKFYGGPLGELTTAEDRRAEIKAALDALDAEMLPKTYTVINALCGDAEAQAIVNEKCAAHEAAAAPLRAALAALPGLSPGPLSD